MALIDTGTRTYLLKQDVQTIIRYYFIVIWFALAQIGNYCCGSRASLRILSGENVSIASMTGWIRGLSVLKTAWKLRSVPGGWLGFIMIIAFPLSLLSDIGLNYFLVALSVSATCPFGTGLVIDATLAAPVPGNQGSPYSWADMAQSNANSNFNQFGFDGRTGSAVYRKANNDTSFLPRTDLDVIGFWNCSLNGGLLQYSGKDDGDIESDLLSRNIIYPDYTGTGLAPTLNDGSFSEQTQLRQLIFISWSSSSVGDIWEIKAAIDMNDIDTETNGKTMQGYHCQAYDSTANKEVSQIISKIAINATMPNWVTGIQGYLWSGQDATSPYPDIELLLGWILNNMMMVSGSQQSVSHVPADGEDQEQGCYVDGTQITIAAWALIFTATVLVLFFICYALFLFIAVRLASKRYDEQHPNSGVTAKNIVDNAPGNLVMWMQHASYEGTNVQVHPEPTQLKSWSFIAIKGKQEKMGIVIPGAIPGEACIAQAAYGPGYTGFADRKGGYVEVHAQEFR